METLRIKNPKTNRQIVYLQEGQNIDLELSDDLAESRINVAGNFLGTSNPVQSGGVSVHSIRQKEAKGINEHSTIYLGEISIENSTNLLVYLHAKKQTNRNRITVVTPCLEDIRLRPNQLLEVVMSDEVSYRNWNWRWEAATYELEMLEHRAFFHPSISTEFPTRAWSKCGRQKHFWFQFGEISHLLFLNEKNVFVGKLYMSTLGSDGQYLDGTINIYVDLLPKYRKYLEQNPIRTGIRNRFYYREVEMKVEPETLETGCRVIHWNPK